ncbi:ribbon-helix-helix domain-containing protein [Alteromonas oceanisediminis]|uniref:ribbon-helix-helix domain-containing protein n=1 Tax=Alteromonas oceanisediminis TaxID=2836180 RepID=UPI001BDB2C06|nr:CopG family transcriptional regulator [Alteromonas oceanisediminis]MBT0585509.1 hypothetical protein [Alteromonas oceanisediminis]
MSLATLKKTARSVKNTDSNAAVDVDSFIQGAVVYANGGVGEADNVIAFHAHGVEQPIQSPLKRATFTLGDEAIAQLGKIAKRNGVAKSKMLRLLIAAHSEKGSR